MSFAIGWFFGPLRDGLRTFHSYLLFTMEILIRKEVVIFIIMDVSVTVSFRVSASLETPVITDAYVYRFACRFVCRVALKEVALWLGVNQTVWAVDLLDH